MHIETKFSNGDRVFYATTDTACNRTPCAECEYGRLRIEGKNMTVACPACSGRGHHDYWSEIVPLAEPMTIGQVRLEITESPGVEGSSIFSNYGPQRERVEQYMCVETGIGSGSVYCVEDLFTTEAEALVRAKWKVVEAKKHRDDEAVRQEAQRESLAKKYETDEA